MAVCKTVGIAYVGSNPTPATSRSSGVDQLIRQVDLLTSRLNRPHAEGSGLSSGTRFPNGLSLGMTRRGPCLSGFDWPVVSVRIRLVAPDAIPTLPRLACRQEHVPFGVGKWAKSYPPSRGCGRTRRRKFVQFLQDDVGIAG
jgi:hypothetical protein